MPTLTRLHRILSALPLALAASSTLAQSYTFVDLGNQPGWTWSYAQDINESGQVVGYAYNSQFKHKAVLWSGGSITALTPLSPAPQYSAAYGLNDTGTIVGTLNDSPYRAVKWTDGTPSNIGFLAGASDSAPADVNNAGQVVGSSTLSGTGYSRATLWQGGQVTSLGTLGGTESWASGINQAGHVAGAATRANSSTTHATVWRDGQTFALTAPSTQGSWANDINDQGQVVGWGIWAAGADRHAALWRDGQVIDLGTLGGRSSTAVDINNRGEAVGYSLISGNTAAHATLWRQGQVIDLNTALAPDVASTWELFEAVGINDQGWIAANARHRVTNVRHAVLLQGVGLPQDPVTTAVPEPSTVGLFAAGVGLAWGAGRRRRQAAQTRIKG